MPTLGETFDTGTPVEAHGVYVCAPCGYKKKLDTGDTFPECDSCMRKNDEEVDEDDRTAPSGIWEYVGEEEGDDEIESIEEIDGTKIDEDE